MTEKNTPPLNPEKMTELLHADGLLSRALKGFESRPQQKHMLANIVEAYNHDHISLIEAGTGTGKSMAYLLPALIWAAKTSERTVISTNTITLQEQLINKDIPNLLKALKIDLKAVLVKGMNNYVCIRKLEDAQFELPFFSPEDKKEIEKITEWKHSTTDGTRSDLPFVASHPVWERVGAEHEACQQKECPHFQECYFFKARRHAQEAQILVVNHHLLFADIARRAETENYTDPAVLPNYKRVIIDEAHHIEEIATEYFASRLHRIELMRTLGRLASDKAGQPGRLPVLKDKIQSFLTKAPSGTLTPLISRLTIDLPALRHQILEQINQTFDSFVYFISHMKNTTAEEQVSQEQKLRILKEHQMNPLWKQEIEPHALKLIATLLRYRVELNGLEGELKLIDHDRFQEQSKGVRLDIQALGSKLENSITLLQNFVAELKDPNKVRWIEAQKVNTLLNVHLVNADLDISKALVDFLFSKFPTIILCSATLTTNQQFNFMRQRLGLTDKLMAKRSIKEHTYDSPFNYQKQALLLIPTDIPQPSDPNFNQIAYENIWNAIQACHGQAFVLFTSYSMMQSCYNYLGKRLADNRYPLYKQGDDNRQTLLNNFKKMDRAVLFGTDSFWEGVDVAGDALRCVIIVKLPFKVPTEPMVQARTESITAQGGDAFYDYSIPHAIVKFKQGFGRLIRNQWDRGCIVCLDIRLVTKGYGKLFLNSLPPCEKVFAPSAALWPKMTEFYKQTYHLVKKNPFN
jgi:ATP-dependent DNA helicase DinG